jgi:hypothetical protein
MNQMIFRMQLPVETVSVYLLCCALHDEGIAVSTAHLAERWNGAVEALEQGLKSLEEKHILRRIISDADRQSVYQLQDVDRWKTTGLR